MQANERMAKTYIYLYLHLNRKGEKLNVIRMTTYMNTWTTNKHISSLILAIIVIHDSFANFYVRWSVRWSWQTYSNIFKSKLGTWNYVQTLVYAFLIVIWTCILHWMASTLPTNKVLFIISGTLLIYTKEEHRNAPNSTYVKPKYKQIIKKKKKYIPSSNIKIGRSQKDE